MTTSDDTHASFERTCIDCHEKYVTQEFPTVPRCPACKAKRKGDA